MFSQLVGIVCDYSSHSAQLCNSVTSALGTVDIQEYIFILISVLSDIGVDKNLLTHLENNRTL